MLAIVLAVCAFPPGSGGGEKTVIRIGLSKSPAALPVLRMLEAKALGDDVELRVTPWGGPEQLIAMVQNGGAQMFSLPLTIAVRLRGRGFDIRLTNVNTWGGIRLVAADPSLRDWRDLEGRRVFLPPRTSPPDALLRFFLARAGLDPDADLTLVRASVTEIGQLLGAGRIDCAVLTEPHATAALARNAGLHVAIDFEEEWKRAAGAGIPMLGFGGTGSFLEANPDLTERFEQAYREALDWVLAHPAEAGRLAEKHLGMRAALLEPAVPRLGLRYRTANEARADVEAFVRLLREHDSGKGGALPDAAFYWR